MNAIRVAQVHYPVTVLGPGTRLGIWLQGCHLGCRGCVSRDTWNPDDAALVPVSRLIADCVASVIGPLDGVTISGGEPFEQPESLALLVTGLRLALAGRGKVDFLCYSGFAYDVLRLRFGDLLGMLDAVIPEPFVAAQAGDDPWRGSANQPVVPLSFLGQERYGALPDGASRSVQISVTEDRVTFVGIPRRKDLATLERRLSSEGVALDGVSWRP